MALSLEKANLGAYRVAIQTLYDFQTNNRQSEAEAYVIANGPFLAQAFYAISASGTRLKLSNEERAMTMGIHMYLNRGPDSYEKALINIFRIDTTQFFNQLLTNPAPLEQAQTNQAQLQPRSSTSPEAVITPAATTPRQARPVPSPSASSTAGNAPQRGPVTQPAKPDPVRPSNKGVGGDAFFEIKPVNSKYGSGVTMELLPARQSFTPGQGQRVPGAGAGLTISTRANIARLPIPASRPIYQHMGILEEVITFVGAFTGFDLPVDNYLHNNKIRSTTAYEDALQFLEVVRPGFEIELTMKTVATGGSTMELMFKEVKTDSGYTPIKFRGFIRNFQQEIATAQRVYYRVEMVVTNREQTKFSSEQSPDPPKAPPVPIPPKPISLGAVPANTTPEAVAARNQTLTGGGIIQTAPGSTDKEEVYIRPNDEYSRARQFRIRYTQRSPSPYPEISFQGFEFLTPSPGIFTYSGPVVGTSNIQVRPNQFTSQQVRFKTNPVGDITVDGFGSSIVCQVKLTISSIQIVAGLNLQGYTNSSAFSITIPISSVAEYTRIRDSLLNTIKGSPYKLKNTFTNPVNP